MKSIHIYFQSIMFEPGKTDVATLRFDVKFQTKNKEDMKEIMDKKQFTLSELLDFINRAE